jgi:hypothetical protein
MQSKKEIKRRKADWIGHILHRKCLPKHVIEEKIKKTRVWRRRRKQLLVKERRRYGNMTEEALDRTLRRTRFGSGYGPVLRQTTKWMIIGSFDVAPRCANCTTASTLRTIRIQLTARDVKESELDHMPARAAKIQAKTFVTIGPARYLKSSTSETRSRIANCSIPTFNIMQRNALFPVTKLYISNINQCNSLFSAC